MSSVNATFNGVAINTILSDPAKFAESLRVAKSAINEKVKQHGDFDLFTYHTQLPPLTKEEEAQEAQEDAYVNEEGITDEARAARRESVNANREARYLERMSKSISAAAFDDQNLLLVAREGASLQVSPYGENPSGKIVNLFAIGSTGDDALIGGKGNDVLVSGGSVTGFGDILKGGGGSDTFIVSEGLTYIHGLTTTSTILVPPYRGIKSQIDFPSPYLEPDKGSIGEIAVDLSVQVTIGKTQFVVNFTLDELNSILGRSYASILKAWENMQDADKSKLSNYITSRMKPLLPSDDVSSRTTAYNSTTQSTWNYAFGEQGKDVVGTMGRDSIFGKGMNITMTGGAGGDNFHVKAGMGTVIADFNFHQRDRIVMDDVKLADFKKELVRVERSGADFIVRYSGNIIAKLLNYEGMPRTDAPAKIRELVTGS